MSNDKPLSRLVITGVMTAELATELNQALRASDAIVVEELTAIRGPLKSSDDVRDFGAFYFIYGARPPRAVDCLNSDHCSVTWSYTFNGPNGRGRVFLGGTNLKTKMFGDREYYDTVDDLGVLNSDEIIEALTNDGMIEAWLEADEMRKHPGNITFESEENVAMIRDQIEQDQNAGASPIEGEHNEHSEITMKELLEQIGIDPSAVDVSMQPPTSPSQSDRNQRAAEIIDGFDDVEPAMTEEEIVKVYGPGLEGIMKAAKDADLFGEALTGWVMSPTRPAFSVYTPEMLKETGHGMFSHLQSQGFIAPEWSFFKAFDSAVKVSGSKMDELRSL